MTFQCSSASRKFLNRCECSRRNQTTRFSALQRAENSSIRVAAAASPPREGVSVLFSEPKIPQFKPVKTRYVATVVSVLFSEPKIPQLIFRPPRVGLYWSFSALQRAENSSTRPSRPPSAPHRAVSVLFSEPKIPQQDAHERVENRRRFQCSSASRKFLNL